MSTVNNQVVDRELGWDDEITQDAQEFIILPPGTYDFTIASFERGRFAGSDKMPACPLAVVHLDIIDPTTGQKVSVRNQFLLHSRTEWTIAQFFTALGLKKKGEPMVPRWNEIVGKTGKCVIENTTYNDKTYNGVKEFIEIDNTLAAVQNEYNF